MSFLKYFLLSLFMFANFTTVLFANFTNVLHTLPRQYIVPFNRTLFPSDFLFGASSSAYQIEGAWNEDGKGTSIWDKFTHDYPDHILDGSNGDVATDFYRRYKDDIKLIKDQGLDTFRFSIAWSRILPRGTPSGGINLAGIDFYNRVINDTIANGIKPLVTLFHWDLPQALEDAYLGFLSPNIVDDYVAYADICFKNFGDRVKKWATINEVHTYAIAGYDQGAFAPGRCSQSRRDRYCPVAGNSSTEPYKVAHHMLLAHAHAVKLYRDNYKAKQNGEIGMIHGARWFEPYSKKQEDVDAAKRAVAFVLGWSLHPLVYGDYPKVMKDYVGERLPNFTEEEKKLLEGSSDYVGLNHYSTCYAANNPTKPNDTAASTDNQVDETNFDVNDVPVGEETPYFIFNVVPEGFKKILLHIKDTYKDPIIYVTECGYGDTGTTEVENGVVNDPNRICYYKRYIKAMHSAYKKGVKVKAFYAWSFYDNFEWFQGYKVRFGLNFIDYKNNLKRYPKKSALWFKKFLLKDQKVHAHDQWTATS